MSYIERLKQNAHLFLKTPNVGRPTGVKNKAEGNAKKNKGDEKQEIIWAIKKVLEETVGSINAGNLHEIIGRKFGKLRNPRLEKKMAVTCVSLYIWLKEYELDFEKPVGDTSADFFSGWREPRKMMS